MDNVEISYSVIIRTVGTAHDKYQALLNAITLLSPQPSEVIVVLPEGYEKPKEQLGYEKFYFSKKGMSYQRELGIKVCNTRYALICDDDVVPEPDFVNKLHEPIKQGKCGISAAPLYSFLPEKGIRGFIDVISGNAMPTMFHKNRYVSVLKSTGYSYNRHLDLQNHKYYESQSVAGTCFYADVEQLRSVNFEEETWLDDNGYAAMEDQVLIYKAWLMGIKTVVVSDAFYEHLDGKTSTRNNKPAVVYSLIFNRILFWKRFLSQPSRNVFEKCIVSICFRYRLTCNTALFWLNVLRGSQTKNDFELYKKGMKDGFRYIKSPEFMKLTPITKKNL